MEEMLLEMCIEGDNAKFTPSFKYTFREEHLL